MRHRDDDGSAVVEFTLVLVLLLFLFLAVAQVGVVLHTRNVLVAAAQEGARYGANADRTPEQGAQRTTQVVAGSLSRRTADAAEVSATTALVGGAETVEVVVTAPLPVLFVAVGSLRLTVRGHALREGS